MKLLVINPGSTSTKIALFENHDSVFSKTIRHDAAKIQSFPNIISQLDFRFEVILQVLQEAGVDLATIDAYVGRGGLLRPVPGGTFEVCPSMLDDLRAGRFGEHASNLGAVIASMMAQPRGKKAYIVNPVVVDEMMDAARLTGVPEIRHTSVFHALNHKAVANRAAREHGFSYSQARLIVAHLGGGVTVGAHDRGRVIDVNNGLEEGPFSPERAGSLPFLQLMDLCYSGQYTKSELKRKLIGNSGFVAYAGTSDGLAVEQKAEADPQIRLMLEAFAYRVAADIGAKATALYGKVDYILITGGLARSELLVSDIKARVGFLAPVLVYPGEDEMQALAEGAIEVLEGRETVQCY